MTNPFDTFFEGQKKMMDWWSENSSKMMESFTNEKTEDAKPTDFIQTWFERQQKLFEEASRIRDPKEAAQKAPDYFKKWMDLQMELSDKWMETYRHNAEKMGVKMPEMNGNAPSKVWEKSWDSWSDRLREGNDWMVKNVMDKLPANMQPHFMDFNDIYNGMYRMWEPITRMIQFGAYDKNLIDRYFPTHQYQDIINKFMGFRMTGDSQEWLENANKLFEQYISYMNDFLPSARNMQENWQKRFQEMSGSSRNPFFQFTLDINKELNDNIDPFINLMGFDKSSQMIRMLKDMQFAYAAFLTRTAEMQTKVYEAGQYALPETIKAFNEEYQDKKEMPAFETFFNRYINTLENHLTELLESNQYSKLQAEVSKLGVTVKGQMDALMEMTLEDTPFLMKSHGDDLAKETATLRRKIRELERQVKSLSEKKPASTSRSKKKTTAKS